MKQGPLAGTAVIDASWGMPGSVASLLLADYGARVIKIDRPDPPLPDSALVRQAWDRGKESIVLDARLAADRAHLLDLIARADVFIESFGPGRAESYGLGYPSLHAAHPRLIYGSITAYGHSGPWRDEPGWMHLVAAKMGIMAEQSNHGREGPTFLGHPHIGYGTGFVMAISLLAALYARNTTQRGQFVDVSLLDGLLAQSPMNWWHQKDGLSYVERTGAKRSGFGRKRLITSRFECGDGEYIQIHTGGPGAFKRTMEIFGFGDITQDVTEGSDMALLLNDEEFVIAREYIPEAFKQRPRDEWVEEFLSQDIAAVPVLRPGQVLDDIQVRHADMAMDVQHPVHGTVKQAAPPLRFFKAPIDRPLPAPAYDAHRQSVLEFAASALRAAGDEGRPLAHPLAGIRVLDFASYFASPYGAKILSDLGADVIQIEAPGGDQMRALPNPFEACQRGKRNLVVNLKTAAGRAIVHALVKTADVIVHNQRPGKAEKIGLGYDELAAIKPDLVYCYLPGYGSSGPRAHQKSFAPLQSGFTGLLYEAAGRGNPPVMSVEGNEDYYNGLLGATAVLMALNHRARTGQGQKIESPQLHSSLFVTSHLFLDANHKSLPAIEIDSGQMGWNALNRLYRTRDHWICIAVVGGHAWSRLCAALSLPATLRDQGDEAVIAALTTKFAELTSAEAHERLRAHRVPCEIPADDSRVPEIFFADWAVNSDRVFIHPDSMHGPIREIGLYMHLSDTPGVKKGPAPRHGQHTAEILKELGYDAATIEGLAAKKVIIKE